MAERILLFGTALLALSACATNRERDVPDAVADVPADLAAVLQDRAGRTVAQATVEQAGDSLRVRLEASGLAPGAYGAHIHEAGRCDAPDFASAGPHWNPTDVQHGKDNPRGMHKGDLPNLLVGADGRGSFEYTVPNAVLAGRGPNPVLDGDAASVVVHASPDDFRTDPSGNSGARIACGVLR
jgi:Cu-Zn family superoxide dismutase